MKVLIFSRIDDLHASFGSAIHLKSLYEYLNSQGHQAFYWSGWPRNYGAAWYRKGFYFDSPIRPRALKEAEYMINQVMPDAIITDYPWLNGIFDLPECKNLKKICFVHDLRTRIVPCLKNMGIKNNEYWNEKKEAELLRKADALLVLNGDDEKDCNRMAPEAKTIRIGIALPTVDIPSLGAAFNSKMGVLYIAAAAEQNYYALKWFIDNVWERVLIKEPQATLLVCGSIGRKKKKWCPQREWSIRVIEDHESLDLFYAASKIAVVPHFLKGGLKIKTAEAFAHGLPVVATSCGLDGFEDAIGSCALAVNNPSAFAICIHGLLTNDDHRDRMSKKALQFAKDRMNPEAAYGALQK